MDYPRIIYPPNFDEWDFRDMEVGGLGGAEVQVEENRIVKLTFVDIPRLIELNKSAEEAGLPCYYRKNLVVLSKLTKEKIEETVKYLFKSNYFGSA